MTASRLYTARYANPTLADHAAAKVRISLGYPRFPLRYQLAGTIGQLAPDRSYFKDPEAVFRGLYKADLLRRGGTEYFAKLFIEIAERAGVDALALLCFEDLRRPNVFCHRRIFAEWWEARTGQEVEELPEA
jgi:hypothetical protein